MPNKFLYKSLINHTKKKISIISGGRALSKPLQISIQPNRQCNARCLMCHSWHENKDYINSFDIINVLKQLKKWLGSDFFVNISGGEVLIFEGIFDIFSFCADNKIISKISTNGVAFDENILNKIIDSKLSFLSVSLDSHIAELHDKYRGVAGVFERSVSGIRYLAKNSNITLGISSVIMKENIDTLADSVMFFLSLPVNRILLQPIRPWTYEKSISQWKEYEYWVNDSEAMQKFSDFLINLKKTEKRILNTNKDISEWNVYFSNPEQVANDFIKKCSIGYDNMIIDYKGDIFLGCYLFGSIGNIKDINIKTAWKSKRASDIRSQMMSCKNPCTSNCYKELSLKEKVKKAILLLRSGLFK